MAPLPAKKSSGSTVSALPAASESFDKIAALMALMNEQNFTALEFEEKDFKVRLEKYPAVGAGGTIAVAAPISAPIGSAVAPKNAVDPSGLTPIKSPIVGTFYGSPSPDSAPFVAIGDRVTAESIVCIIEAMKIMNEIKAEITGTIEQALVENGDPIEYGQPLFLVRK